MEYRSISNTDLELSVITFGAWAAGGWMWGKTDRKDAIDAIRASYDLGVTSIDTAPIYGQGESEEIVSEAIQGIPRDKVQILTKFGMRWDLAKGTLALKSKNNRGEDIDIYKYAGKESVIKECEDSLRRLKTDYIDLYQIHWHVINTQEIEKSPGANRDISRIVQSYPGVSFSPGGYRNDLIVRGGGPSENRFFLDGIEIPNINHFSTQGASGGPVGLINADLIREVSFYTAAFPSYSSNALSSVLSFKLADGNPDKHSFKATLGASEASVASDGPLGNNTTYTLSVRRSYLQFLFDLFGLPFLPTYNDLLFKVKTKRSSVHDQRCAIWFYYKLGVGRLFRYGEANAGTKRSL